MRNRSTGTEDLLHADGLFLMIGAQPRTDWLPASVGRDRTGFVLAGSDAANSGGWPLERSPHPYETTLPGLFAVGEGSVVVSQLHQVLNPVDG